jgi:hypothetical protein
MANALVLQKVQTIKVAQTDPTPIVSAGASLRLDPDVGHFHTLRFGLREGEQLGFGWTDSFLVRFDDHVELTLRQENNFGLEKLLGSLTVPSSQLNTNERSFDFTESGAHVVLTYFVRKWPCD